MGAADRRPYADQTIKRGYGMVDCRTTHPRGQPGTQSTGGRLTSHPSRGRMPGRSLLLGHKPPDSIHRWLGNGWHWNWFQEK